MAQRTGALIFDEHTDRYDIRFDIADYYGGLHCGECMEVFTGGKWKPTRIEYGENWYLVGIRAEDMRRCTVCGASFASSSNSVKYCPDCRKRITRKQAAERMRKRRALVTQ